MVNADGQSEILLSKPVVAIVDDNESIREAVEGLLRSIGCRAESFASAEEFLATGWMMEIDCVILDLKLGGMDGLALQRRLLETDRLLPIIFITAHWNETARAEALRLGAVDFLSKPCSETALLQAIDGALKAGWRRAPEENKSTGIGRS